MISNMIDLKEFYWLNDNLTIEAKDMLNKYATLGVPLTGIEKAAMIEYVDAEVLSGNHALKDYETIYSLSEPNSLVDYIGGKVATKVNSPIWSINGYSFEITKYIDTNFNPTVDGVNYQLNDAQYLVFLQSFTGNGFVIESTDNLFGVQSVSQWRVYGHETSLRFFNTNWVYGKQEISFTIDINSIDLVINGFTGQIISSIPVSIPNVNIHIGSSSFTPFSGNMSNLIIGAKLPNQLNHYNNLVTLLTNLGVSL